MGEPNSFASEVVDVWSDLDSPVSLANHIAPQRFDLKTDDVGFGLHGGRQRVPVAASRHKTIFVLQRLLRERLEIDATQAERHQRIELEADLRYNPGRLGFTSWIIQDGARA